MSFSYREPAVQDIQRPYTRLMDLHTALHPRVRTYNLDLHPRWQKSSIICQQSAASTDEADSWVLTYFRSREQAEVVERMMGKEMHLHGVEPDTYRHPVIELRMTPDHFAVELIVSPGAWWDQQNLVGKLEIPQHRVAFRSLLRQLAPDYCFGFWRGTHLSDMHLTTAQLLKGRILDDWMNTFTEGMDWLRLGKWYDIDDPILEPATIMTEAFEVVKALHPIYSFLLWTGNNNFHSFYEKRQRSLRRVYN